MVSSILTPTATKAARLGSVRAKLPALGVIAMICMLLPIYFRIDDVVLSPSRMFFVLSVPVLAIRLLMGKYGGVLLVDWLVAGYVIWSALAILDNNGANVQFIGMNSAVILGGYLVGRAAIRTPEHFLALAKLFAGVALFSIPFVIIEAQTNEYVIPKWFDMIPGVNPVANVDYGERLGLFRSQFVFAHPIHYGLFCSIAFGLAFFCLKDRVSTFTRFIVCVLVGFACFMSVSSGPFLSLLTQIALIGWTVVTKSIRGRWKILLIGLFILYLILEVMSEGPAIYRIVMMIAFSPDTAFYRRLIFDYGMAQINRTPFLGVGQNNWGQPFWMTGSIDNYWLQSALLYGVPAFAFIISSFIMSIVLVGRRNFDDYPLLLNARLGWAFVMISLILTLATVAIWSEIQSIVFMVLGSGMWLLTYQPEPIAQAGPNQAAAIGAQGEQPARRSRYTRFDHSPTSETAKAGSMFSRQRPKDDDGPGQWGRSR